MKGKVIRINTEKGFGFILSDDDVLAVKTETQVRERSRFFHASDVQPLSAFDLLVQGSPVEFDESSAPDTSRKGNGLRAKKVRRIS